MTLGYLNQQVNQLSEEGIQTGPSQLQHGLIHLLTETLDTAAYNVLLHVHGVCIHYTLYVTEQLYTVHNMYCIQLLSHVFSETKKASDFIPITFLLYRKIVPLMFRELVSYFSQSCFSQMFHIMKNKYYEYVTEITITIYLAQIPT